jgi:hypothetical protein
MGKKSIKRLLGKKGESLVLVLILMFFFMIICVSVSAAAMSGIRYSGMQRDFNHAMLIERSIHDNIMYSLQADPESANTLGWQIINNIRVTNGGQGDMPLTVTINDAELNALVNDPNNRIRVHSVMLRLPEQQLIERGAVPALYQTEHHPTRCYKREVCMTAESDVCSEAEGCYYYCTFEGHTDFSCCPGFEYCPEFGLPGHICCNPGFCLWVGHMCGLGPGSCNMICFDAFMHHVCVWDAYGACITGGGMILRERHECVYPPIEWPTPTPPGCDIEDNETRDGEIPTTTFTARRIPRSSTIIATLTVTVEININGRISTSRAVFTYTGGALSDCMRLDGECFIACAICIEPDNQCCPLPMPPLGMNEIPPPLDRFCCMREGDFDNPMQFVAGEHGRWEFESYEIIE